ncbi:MAG: hypothetical protein ACRC8J_03215, partial [Phocaeicola sp.]
MKKITLFYSLLLCCTPIVLNAQEEGVTQCGRLTGQAPFPIYEYQELIDHNSPNPEEWNKVKGVQVSWVNSNIRYEKHKVPANGILNTQQATVWRGENVNAQIALWSNQEAGEISFSFSPLKSGSN